MIKTRIDSSNNFHPCTHAKKGRWVGAGRARVLEGGAGGGVVHIQYINKAEEINKEKFTYMKAADPHRLCTTLSPLLLTLPWGSALHTTEKSKDRNDKYKAR